MDSTRNLNFQRRDACPMCSSPDWSHRAMPDGTYLGGICAHCGPVSRCEGCGVWGGTGCWVDCPERTQPGVWFGQ